MDSKTYVLKHDYGYGKDVEAQELNKLHLRNFEDLQIYLQDLLEQELMTRKDVSIMIKTQTVELI